MLNKTTLKLCASPETLITSCATIGRRIPAIPVLRATIAKGRIQTRDALATGALGADSERRRCAGPNIDRRVNGENMQKM